MYLLGQRKDLKWYWNVLIALIIVVGTASLGWFIIPLPSYRTKEPWYHFRYELSISTNQSGNYSIIVPALIHNRISPDILFNESGGRKDLFNRLNELTLISGTNDTQYETINTSKGYGLQISSSNNVSFEVNLTGDDWDSFDDAQYIMLGTTINDSWIVGPDYECWIYFDNQSEVKELNLQLLLFLDYANGKRTISITADFNEGGWFLVPGEYRWLFIG